MKVSGACALRFAPPQRPLPARPLARAGLLRTAPNPGERPGAYVARALSLGLTGLPGAPRVRLTNDTLSVSYPRPYPDVRQIRRGGDDLCGPWLHSVLTRLSVHARAWWPVWTPSDAWAQYQSWAGTVPAFRRMYARATGHEALAARPETTAFDEEIQAWAAALDHLDPWTVARALGVNLARPILPMTAVQRDARTPAQRRVAALLAELKTLDAALPVTLAARTPLPLILVLLDGDDGLGYELAAEAHPSQVNVPAFEVGVQDHVTVARYVNRAPRAAEIVTRLVDTLHAL